MNIDERTRHALHERLDVVLGQEEAVTLMSYLPPVGWADVATKRDLDILANQLRTELHKEIGSVHKEIGSVRGELHKEIGSVHKEIGLVRGEMSKQTRTFVLSLMGSNATLAALAFAAARLV